MKVVFLQNLKGVAKIGDIKNVNDGYARNFLFPKNVAKPATDGTIKHAETLKQKAGQAYVTNKKEAEDLAQKFDGFVLEMKEDANDEGHLYGSINEKKIAQAMKNEKLHIFEDQINLPEHIKIIGEHEVEIELHPEVKTKLKMLVSKK
jgi:large subunit ribosomal protein L9